MWCHTGATQEEGDSGVHNDAEVAHAVAASLGVDLSVIEAAIMEHHGDLDSAMEVWMLKIPGRMAVCTHADTQRATCQP